MQATPQLTREEIERLASGFERWEIGRMDNNEEARFGSEVFEALPSLLAMARRLLELEEIGRELVKHVERDWRPGTVGYDIYLKPLRAALTGDRHD